MSKATYIIRTNNAAQEYFVLRAPNNEPILTSEAYTAHHNVLNGIDAVRFNSQHDNRFECRTSTRGEPYFVLKGGNHESWAGARCTHPRLNATKGSKP